MENIIQSLNAPQKEAVLQTEGPLLILAGAGTGKTRVLITRLAHILVEGLAQPHEVMAVTFTNKAAREMKQRIEETLGRAMPGMWLGTFHGLCARLLRQHPERAGLSPNFTIIDMGDQLRLCKEILLEKGLDDKKWPARQLVNTISRFKDNAWLPKDIPLEDRRNFDRKIVEIYELYQNRLAINNAVDFGDLLLKTLRMLQESEDLLDKYQTHFKYVLVDEYQDTNNVQYLWIRLITMHHKNICVVGDDDQSIYGWRGAQVGNILKFEKDYPGCKIVKLEQNYRSTSNILKAAATLISNNDERHDKTLWSAAGDGDPIEVHPLWDGKEEARFIADRIDRDVAGGKTYPDMAVLLRTAAQTRAIEEQFIKTGVPYQIVGGLKFYERKEIRDAIGYLRLVLSESDGMAFERIVNVPRRGVGDTAISTIRNTARRDDVNLMTASRTAVMEGTIGRSATKVKQFHELVDYLRNKMPETTPCKLMELILDQSGYHDMLKADKNKEEAQSRLENLKELVRGMQEYETVESFLEHVSLVMDVESEDEDTVKVTTVHSAKGLEFDTVFIPGFEDGLFPHQRSLNDEGQKGLEEERRLAYVAITRAKKTLIISHASSRFMYGHFEPAMPSPFLAEIPKECLSIKSGGGKQQTWRASLGSSYDNKGRHNTPMFGGEKKKYGKKPSDGYNAGGIKKEWDPVPFAERRNAEGTEYPLGTRVFHQKFGYGRVKRQEGTGANEKLTIAFDKAGEKKLLTQLANLEKA